MPFVGYLKDKTCDPFRTQKALLMGAMLKHVPRYGWTSKALQRAAEELSATDDADLIFASARAYDYICAAYDLGEQRLAQDLLQAQKEGTWQTLRVREKVARGVRMRLEPWSQDRAAFRRALPIAVQPQHLLSTMRYLYRTLDTVWRAAGDRSVDHNFYTKRALLALALVPTLLFWLRDRSEGCARTWVFLGQRIDKAMKLGQRLGNPSARKKTETARGKKTSILNKLRISAALLRATLVKGKMHAKPF